MTWHHLLRTVVIAVLGALALGFVSQAKAESGSGVIPPQEAEELAAAHKADLAEEADPSEKKAADGKSKDAAEETAAIPPSPNAAKSRSRVTDAVRASALAPLIARYASESGVPFELADAVVRIESRYNPAARNGPNMGLTQINFRTAQSLGYQGTAAGLLEPETNLRYGLKYLAQAYKLAGGDTCGTILRYQFGHRTQTMTTASRAYCARVKMITASAE